MCIRDRGGVEPLGRKRAPLGGGSGSDRVHRACQGEQRRREQCSARSKFSVQMADDPRRCRRSVQRRTFADVGRRRVRRGSSGQGLSNARALAYEQESQSVMRRRCRTEARVRFSARAAASSTSKVRPEPAHILPTRRRPDKGTDRAAFEGSSSSQQGSTGCHALETPPRPAPSRPTPICAVENRFATSASPSPP